MFIKSRLQSFRCAIKGIMLMFREEQNAIIHLMIAIVAILAGIILNISVLEWGMIAFAIGFVLAAEAVNTAIERLVDMISPNYHEMARKIKDLAAGAVLLAALTAIIIGLIIFIPKIVGLSFGN